VSRIGKSIVEEDDLKCFFHDAGCKVAGVRLVIDAKRHDASRGFGFVDFEDHESLDLALKLHNTEAKGLSDKDGKLRIEKARPATEKGKEGTQELSNVRKQTEEMEREPAVDEARCNEVVQEGKRKRDQQNVAEAQELQVQGGKRRRFDKLLRPKDAEKRIHAAIELEEEPTTETEAIVVSIDGEQTRRHQDEASVCENSSATLALLPRDDLGPPAVTSGPTQHNCGAPRGSGAIAVEQKSNPGWHSRLVDL